MEEQIFTTFADINIKWRSRVTFNSDFHRLERCYPLHRGTESMATVLLSRRVKEVPDGLLGVKSSAQCRVFSIPRKGRRWVGEYFVHVRCPLYAFISPNIATHQCNEKDEDGVQLTRCTTKLPLRFLASRYLVSGL